MLLVCLFCGVFSVCFSEVVACCLFLLCCGLVCLFMFDGVFMNMFWFCGCLI